VARPRGYPPRGVMLRVRFAFVTELPVRHVAGASQAGLGPGMLK